MGGNVIIVKFFLNDFNINYLTFLVERSSESSVNESIAPNEIIEEESEDEDVSNNLEEVDSDE